MTTTTPTLTDLFTPSSYAEDPSGRELRRALLSIPAPRRAEPAPLVLAGTAGATLVAGVVRLLMA